ncbi:MAG: EAL domain-containing protein [Solirubrobacteraceae bacterium]|nr:EAL domain-containing protein [Patulibacter sp.]
MNDVQRTRPSGEVSSAEDGASLHAPAPLPRHPGPSDAATTTSPISGSVTAGVIPAAAAAATGGTAPRRAWNPVRRVPVVPIAAAGVLLIGSWITVNYAIGASRTGREQARELAIVAAQADGLSDIGAMLSAQPTKALLARAAAVDRDNYMLILAALKTLPADDEIDTLRATARRLTPELVELQAAIGSGNLSAVRAIGRARLLPTLDRLRSQSASIAAARLHRAEQIETVARIASGLALFGGSAGLGLVALLFAGLRQRSLVERTRAEIEERTSTRLDALVSHATDAVTVLDSEGRITWISSAPAFPLARAPQQAIGHFFTDLIHPTDRKRGAAAFAELLSSPGAATTTQLRLATAQGAQRPVEIRGENRLGDPAIEGVILTIHDVSERTLLEDQLERLASRDPVTGLANRAQLEAHLGNAVTRRNRRGGFAALLLVDLDDFRAVSDTLGHDAGDELLRHAARRLEQTAGDGDLVARLDGDTFAVLLDDLRSVGNGQSRAAAILSGLRGNASVTGGHSVDLDAHAGLAFGAVDLPAREIIRHADIALLEAKAGGVKDVVSFTDQMRHKVTQRVALTGDLRRATERDEFEVDYQPIVDLQTGRTVGVEALARWTHPHRGRMAPGGFIDLAEQTGLIRPLGELVLRQSCREIAELLTRDADALSYVSVNISPRQLEDPDITQVVLSALQDANLAPHHLMLELTERSIATDPERLVQRLIELRALGIQIALDDFGSGYSFMSFLEDYPLDALKIDRSLSKSMADRTDAALLLRGIVEISANAGMKVIVEGIETAAQQQRAAELGIELGQGYLFARPTKLSALEFI